MPACPLSHVCAHTVCVHYFVQLLRYYSLTLKAVYTRLLYERVRSDNHLYEIQAYLQARERAALHYLHVFHYGHNNISQLPR